MAFFIDLGGRTRQIRNQDIAIAVRKIGYIYVDVVERTHRARSESERTVIVSLSPRLSSDLAIAALGYKLADLGADRIVVVTGAEPVECSVVTDDLSAMRRIAAVAKGREIPTTVARADKLAISLM
jgi:hypothetical protein